MQVKDIMIKDVITVSPDEAISKALANMRQRKIHQLPVVSNGTLYGMLDLKSVVVKDIPLSTKVATLAYNTPTIDANANVEKVAELLLGAGVRALPVTEGNKLVGIISETDMIKVAKSFVRGLNVKLREIASHVEYVRKGENVGAVRNMMTYKNISRVPVMEGSEIAGIVGTLDLIPILEGKERMDARGGRLKEPGTTEKLGTEKTPVEAIMTRPLVVGGEKTVGEAIDLLKSHEELMVKLENEFGIITTKDILELFAAVPKKQVYVQITGIQDENIEFKAKMDQSVNEFVQKTSKIAGTIEYLYFHVEKHSKTGSRHKYSVRGRLKTPVGLFVSHAWGWDPVTVIQEAVDKLEKETIKKHEKNRDEYVKKRQKNRYR